MTDPKPVQYTQHKFFGGGDPSPLQDFDPESKLKVSESQALFTVVSTLQELPSDELRARVLEGALAFFRILVGSPSYSRPPLREADAATVPGSFSEDRTTSPKDFVLQKQPRSEVERVACLAYYLTHYRETQHFKTFDISKLNTEAAQPKFTNASQAVENATRTNYLAPATKGTKQLSGPGELFVQMMPDRDAARAAMQNAMPRRRRRAAQPTLDVEENSVNE